VAIEPTRVLRSTPRRRPGRLVNAPTFTAPAVGWRSSDQPGVRWTAAQPIPARLVCGIELIDLTVLAVWVTGLS
jgi:hypothetical protein